MTVSRLRIAYLAREATGYLDSCLQALADFGDDVFVSYPRQVQNTAFDALRFDDYAQTYSWEGEPDATTLLNRVRDFGPHAVIMWSWNWPAAHRAVMKDHPEAVSILFMDNVWLATPRQWLGRLTHRWYLDPVFDCALVPGDRTEFFARRLGFTAGDVIRGAWCGDSRLFAALPTRGDELAARRRFVAALRLVHHKGADILAEAYRHYRELVDEPWQLEVAGIGPLAASFDGVDGVVMRGFLQPSELASLMHRSSCFVLPTRVEPYGLVLHEAAMAGLPIISTDTAGAAPTMLQDGYNGWTVPGGDAPGLARAMARMSTSSDARLGEMSVTSCALASRLTREGWARNLHEEVERRLDARSAPSRT